MDCENCRHLTVVGLHDTGPWRAAGTGSTPLSPVESYLSLESCYSTSHTARRLARWGHIWLTRCRYTVGEKLFDLQLLSQCGSRRFRADPSLAYTCMLLGRQTGNEQRNKHHCPRHPLRSLHWLGRLTLRGSMIIW